MYAVDWDASHPIASAYGYGSIYIDEDDFEVEGDGWFWEDDWDTWYVRIYTDEYEWDEITCEDGTYDLTIES